MKRTISNSTLRAEKSANSVVIADATSRIATASHLKQRHSRQLQKPVFERLEGRELFSATLGTVASVAVETNTGPRTAVYEINAHNQILESLENQPPPGVTNTGQFFGYGPFQNLGNYAKQLATGVDAHGNPEVVIIDKNDHVEVNSGAGWQNLGGYAKQVSASIDGVIYAIGSDDTVFMSQGGGPFTRISTKEVTQISAGTLVGGAAPTVFAIGRDNAAYGFNGSSFVNLGGYVKQISATVNGTFYRTGSDNTVFEHVGLAPNGYINLRLQAKSVAAGTVGFIPHVFAIGLDNALYSSVQTSIGTFMHKVGGYCLELSTAAPSVGALSPSDFVVGTNHHLFDQTQNAFHDLGTYVALPAGRGTMSAVNATTFSLMNPVLSTVYVIGSDDSVFSNTGTGYVHLGGYAKQVSAGLDSHGRPEVYAIGLDDAVYVNDGAGFVRLGGVAIQQISATADNTVYALGYNNAIFKIQNGTITSLGGYAKSISASALPNGQTEVFAIGAHDNAFVVGPAGTINLGGYVKQISAAGGALYAIGGDDTVFINRVNGQGFNRLSPFSVTQISASLDASNNPDVYAIGKDNETYVDAGSTGFRNLGAAFSRDIAAPNGLLGQKKGSPVYVLKADQSVEFLGTALGGYVQS